MTAFASPVQWLPDGTPHNPRFNDRYRGDGDDGLGGILQARHVFLGGCEPARRLARGPQLDHSGNRLRPGPELPRHLAGLARRPAGARAACTTSPSRPGRRRPTTCCAAWPPTPNSALLAQELAERWAGLLPGFHRLAFDEGRVQLTLCIGEVRTMLRELRFEADSVYLDGFTPALNPDMWELHTLKAVSHLCRRGTRVATWTIARSVRDALTQNGFIVEKAPGLPPKRDCLHGRWDPPWSPRRPEPAPVAPWAGSDRRAIVIGAGLAGASAAYSLTRRGWQVTVLDRAGTPAAGASGLPAGVVAPHVSPDDRLLSQLSRSGVMATLARAAELLPEGVAWSACGVLERRLKDSRELPDTWMDPASPGHAWSRTRRCRPAQRRRLERRQPRALARPRRLGARPRPGGRDAGGTRHHLARQRRRDHAAAERAQAEDGSADRDGWTALAADGTVLAQAPLVVVAAGFDSLDLLASTDAPALPLNPLRGQLLWGPMPAPPHPLPPFPVNGLGNFITGVPVDGTPSWVLGSTFERGCRESRAARRRHR